MLADGRVGAHAEVIEGSIVIQVSARVIPVEVALGYFGTGGGVELTKVELEAMVFLRLQADVGLQKVGESIARTLFRGRGGVERLDRGTDAEIDAKADWFRGHFYRHEGQI